MQHNPIWFSARSYHADREGDLAAKLLAQNSSLSSSGVGGKGGLMRFSFVVHTGLVLKQFLK